MEKILFVVAAFTLMLVSCASQRTRATCAETEYRLNSMSYSPDQRAFLEEELRQCRAEQAELEKDDVITNKITGSIRERFAADSAAKAESAVTEISENPVADTLSVSSENSDETVTEDSVTTEISSENITEGVESTLEGN